MDNFDCNEQTFVVHKVVTSFLLLKFGCRGQLECSVSTATVAMLPPCAHEHSPRLVAY